MVSISDLIVCGLYICLKGHYFTTRCDEHPPWWIDPNKPDVCELRVHTNVTLSARRGEAAVPGGDWR